MIPLSVPCIQGNEWKYIKECLDTEWVSTAGDYVTRFEEEVANYIGTKNAVAVVNGTSAIHISLIASDVQPDDEVIVPDMTWIGSVAPISWIGATPVFVDILKDSWCIDPKKIEEAITNSTKAIIAVHPYGNLAEMDEIIAIGKKYDIPIIEDAAESLGSTINGRPMMQVL